jgi:hypothetical protein
MYEMNVEGISGEEENLKIEEIEDKKKKLLEKGERLNRD